MDSDPAFGRRRLLKTLGGTLVASSIAGKAAAKPSSREVYKQGLKIYEKTGKRELFEEHILNRGFRIASQNAETFGYGNNNSKLRHAEPSDLNLYPSVYTDDSVSYAHGSWEIISDLSDAWNDWSDTPEPPKDIIGIGWEHNDYEIKWNTWDSSSYVSQRTASFNNVAWEFDDFDAYSDQSSSDLVVLGWVNVEMDIDDEYDVDKRGIILSYQHTWTSGTVEGISFDSSGGMSISVGIATQKWSSPRQAHSEDELR